MLLRICLTEEVKDDLPVNDGTAAVVELGLELWFSHGQNLERRDSRTFRHSPLRS